MAGEKIATRDQDELQPAPRTAITASRAMVEVDPTVMTMPAVTVTSRTANQPHWRRPSATSSEYSAMPTVSPGACKQVKYAHPGTEVALTAAAAGVLGQVDLRRDAQSRTGKKRGEDGNNSRAWRALLRLGLPQVSQSTYVSWSAPDPHRG